MKNKRIVPIIIAVFLFSALGQKASGLERNYHDVPGSWAQTDIEYLTSMGIISGYPDGNFGVFKNINRGEAAAILIRALKIPDNAPPEPKFTDISDTYFRLPIALAAERGIISGYTNGEFRPDQPLTRAEMASIVVRAYPYLKGSTEQRFDDVSEKNWAFKSIEILVANGITKGFPGNLYKPDQSITRTEFAVFISRILKKHYLPIEIDEMFRDATNIKTEVYQDISTKIIFNTLNTYGIDGKNAMKLYAPFNGSFLSSARSTYFGQTINGGSISYGGSSYLLVSDHEEYVVQFNSFPETVDFSHYMPADYLLYKANAPIDMSNSSKYKPVKKGLEFLLLNITSPLDENGETIDINNQGNINFKLYFRDHEAEKTELDQAYQRYLVDLEEWKKSNPDYEKLGLTPPVYNETKNKLYRKVNSSDYFRK